MLTDGATVLLFRMSTQRPTEGIAPIDHFIAFAVNDEMSQQVIISLVVLSFIAVLLLLLSRDFVCVDAGGYPNICQCNGTISAGQTSPARTDLPYRLLLNAAASVVVKY